MAKNKQEQKDEKVELNWVEGKARRLICARILPGTDFLEGIEEICRQANITSGNLISCVGSLQKFSFIYPKPRGSTPFDVQQVEGTLEILSAQGTIGVDDDGTLFYHIHGLCVDGEGRIWGGHFIKEGMEMPDGTIVHGGNPVAYTLEITIVEHEGIQIRRRTDPSFNVKLLMPEPVA